MIKFKCCSSKFLQFKYLKRVYEFFHKKMSKTWGESRKNNDSCLRNRTTISPKHLNMVENKGNSHLIYGPISQQVSFRSHFLHHNRRASFSSLRTVWSGCCINVDHFCPKNGLRPKVRRKNHGRGSRQFTTPSLEKLCEFYFPFGKKKQRCIRDCSQASVFELKLKFESLK